MRAFNYFAPKTVDEALKILNENWEDILIVAGGTDAMIELNEGHRRPKNVMNITGIDELRSFEEKDGYVHIGALNTFSKLGENEYVRKNMPAFLETVSHVGSPQIRALGTIGGNVVNASVAGDTPTTFMTYDAKVVLRSMDGERKLGIEEFNKGEGKARCQIRPDELMTGMEVPILSKDEAVGYFKIGKRKSLAIVVLAVCIYIRRNAQNKVEDCRVVLGAVNPHPMRAPEIEQAIIGLPVDAESLYSTLPLFKEKVKETIPTRASVVYKREGVRGAAKRCFDRILEQFGQA